MDGENADKYIKASILFGVGGRENSSRLKAINNALLSAKALIAKRLTIYHPLQASELRPIILSAAARYPLWTSNSSVFGDSWTLAADEIRYFPSRSLFYNDAIN
ncbi:Uncharacterized protein FKW44_020060 [Caligus rogercresseyi]|uniref:Uncharacterized protein n=1 Tax=Caligus rogercresseyi TaxID=217165 RepID=A0A7T8GXG7_CALRO|nr:Uncharacterized protein FKW44_020060 [Caligus rogercresseyi]